MRILHIMMLSLFYLTEASASETLKSTSYPLTEYSTNILEKIKKYYPEFPIEAGKVSTQYTKNIYNNNVILSQQFTLGSIGELFSVSINQNSNRIDYDFDYGTGLRGYGYFTIKDGIVNKFSTSCGKDICINDTYNNGILINHVEEIINPFILDEKDMDNFLNLEKQINKRYNFIINNKDNYTPHKVSDENLLKILTHVPRNPVSYIFKINKKSIIYYSYRGDIKIATITFNTNDNRVSSATIYLHNNVPFYVYLSQKENMKIVSYNDKFYELSSGFIVDKGKYTEYTDINNEKYIIYKFSNDRLFYDNDGELFKVDTGSAKYRGWTFDNMEKRFECVFKELFTILKKGRASLK